jgi:hypothetical protein
MRKLKRQERTALEAVARRFSATWEQGTGTLDATLTIAGKRVGVDIATLGRNGPGPGTAAKPRLRFDKVATRVVERLRATLLESVPRRTTVLVTLTAPIRLPAQTAASLEDGVRTLLGRRTPGRDVKATIHGNRAQIRVVRHETERAPTLMGFVHNPESDARSLLDMAREWLGLASAEAARKVAPQDMASWLIVVTARGPSSLEAYRYIHSQLRLAIHYKRVLIVWGDGSVGALTE